MKPQKPFSSNYSLADQRSVIIFFRAWDANPDSSGWEILSNLWTVKRINYRHLVHQWSAAKRCLMKPRKLGASPSLLSRWPCDAVFMSILCIYHEIMKAYITIEEMWQEKKSFSLPKIWELLKYKCMVPYVIKRSNFT